MALCEVSSVENSQLIEEGFKFWFSDNNHIRSPFPFYIHSKLKEVSILRFHQWLENLKEEAKGELADEFIAERFEEIVFEEALKLVKTEDEKITILYPFLPRFEDEVSSPEHGSGKIIDRAIVKEGDNSFLRVVCQKVEDGLKWETSFELPT
jgi:hypothetical protein